MPVMEENYLKMKAIEESVVAAMDGSNPELFPFIPYIMQDLWEIGTDPTTVVQLIRSQFEEYPSLKILDLGCGKGAVSVITAKELGCFCHGIDAVPEFIAYAREKANEYKVANLCRFETGDIRVAINTISGFDVIVLGAIGPVLGNYYSTLTTLSSALNPKGIIIIDDGFIEDDSGFTHPVMKRGSEIVRLAEEAGMQIAAFTIMGKEMIMKSTDSIYEKIKSRCTELAENFPEKKNLFNEYINVQLSENYVLENKVTCAVMVFKRQNEDLNITSPRFSRREDNR